MSRGQSFCWSVVSRSVGYRVVDYLLPCYFLWCVPRYYREGKLPAELRGWHSREPILDAPLPPGQGRGTHCRVVTRARGALPRRTYARDDARETARTCLSRRSYAHTGAHAREKARESAFEESIRE